MKLTDYIIVGYTTPHAGGFSEAAQAHVGELLATDGVHDVSEEDSRMAPAESPPASMGTSR